MKTKITDNPKLQIDVTRGLCGILVIQRIDCKA